MTGPASLSLICHFAVFVGRASIFAASAWALIYTRPARISFLRNLPREMQPIVADIFATAWIYASICLLGGVTAMTRYLPFWWALGMTAANAGAGMALAAQMIRLVRQLPRYLRDEP